MKKYYIAYGSNLNVKQMAWRCPKAKAIGTAVIKDYELLFKGSKSGSYLTIEPKIGASVPVAIWETTEEDEKALDRYEGYPNFYYKKTMTLEVKKLGKEETETVNAYVYIMHEDRALGVPSLSYVSTCVEGYKEYGFDVTTLIKALNKSRRVCNEENR